MTCSATVFRCLGEIPSGPQALLGSKFKSSFFTPSSVMLMFLQSVYSGRSGFGGQRSNSISGAEHRTTLVIEKLGLFTKLLNVLHKHVSQHSC